MAFDSEEKTSNRPSSTALRQQKLSAWRPLLNPKSVIPTFIVLSFFFIPLGAVFLVASGDVEEISIEYTDCQRNGGTITSGTTLPTCKSVMRSFYATGTGAPPNNTICTCYLTYDLTKNLDGPVYLYYGLDGYWQNHRRYVKSVDLNQLRGGSTDGVSENCDPIETLNGVPYQPCGLIANSMFNDTIFLYNTTSSSNPPSSAFQVTLDGNGIAWSSDEDDKFGNPDNWNGAKPPNWPAPAQSYLGTPAWGHPNGVGYKNEDFIVWMRTAGLQDFRKLYRKVCPGGDCDADMAAGSYTFEIHYNYLVDQFGGKKKLYLSNTSWMGAENVFLGASYLLVGCVSFLLGIFFLIRHLSMPRKFGDASLLQSQYQTGKRRETDEAEAGENDNDMN
eukprot:Nk52_evm15s316 gene=Nk52_evmTU15s316